MDSIIIYTQPQPLAVKEYQGQRVITFKDMDTFHQRPEGTARRNFSANRQHFIEGEDFFIIDQPDEIRTLGFRRPQGGTPGSVTLLTKMGYLMLVKSFTDDLAWMVQRQLIKDYFETHTQNVALLSTGRTVRRIRTLPQAVKEMKEADSGSCVTLNALRNWVKSGVIPSTKAGKNFLVDMEALEKYVSCE